MMMNDCILHIVIFLSIEQISFLMKAQYLVKAALELFMKVFTKVSA